MKKMVNLFSSSFICLVVLAQHPTWGADIPDEVTNIYNDEHNLLNSLKNKLHNLNEIMQESVSENSHEVDELGEQEEENIEVEEHQHGNTLEDPTEANEGSENSPQEDIHIDNEADFIGQWIKFMANEEEVDDNDNGEKDSEEDAKEKQDVDTPTGLEENDAPILAADEPAQPSSASNASAQTAQNAQASEDSQSDKNTQGNGVQVSVAPAGNSVEQGKQTLLPTESESSVSSVTSSAQNPDVQLPVQQQQSGEVINGGQNDAPAGVQANPTDVQLPTVGVQNTTTGEHSTNSNDAKINYLDELYDEIITTPDIKKKMQNSSYKTKYKLSLNPAEYQIVKKLFELGFGNENESSAGTSLVEVFKKVLDDEKFQKEFDNIVQGFYGFAKRHNYISQEQMNNTSHTNLLKNAINLMNTL
ncbi:MSP7-like protein, putative [Plasmodium knowlesi strain H]|uniref:MSP7-like protein, putative n=3 Tax=Plasmodium knowlesi TaxID=5850 RepID=A0A5K1UN84_PLAKH|nr:MSP7-like protein [Plasmodium knowlesi strain H]OTN66268.1 putative MSP7-like protein [Plasmodium knowlesi]CAA9989979.1 MSP7-like protein [Plasmodium knowlesi strain H]SBO24568.1 MSP7-like protein, putative [Plasmodium knowlesi strain H]SBO26315.1 MSP7-like protein, putative [Plasmodium knowlesi strain H]VVS79453.1 MSP7-like protein [Plasmodium knowlesi strain H]|eukprot:XP_002259994.1 MSP7-like protein, putative [Plasmodium knowlesi strain H]